MGLGRDAAYRQQQIEREPWDKFGDFAVGRGYDKREYLPFHVSFEDNQGIFEEGLELVRRLWQAEDRISHQGKYYSFEDVRITPKSRSSAQFRPTSARFQNPRSSLQHDWAAG